MTPRIAYVHLNLSPTPLVGIDTALAAQGRACRRSGVPIDIYVLSLHRNDEEDGIRFVKLRTVPGLAKLQRKFFKYALFSQLDAFASYDLVLMRYVPAVDLAPSILMRRSRARIVTVHHTKEHEELLSGPRSAQALMRAWLERVQSPVVLNDVAGLVGVTDEIREYQLRKLRRPKPSATISNGVDVRRVTHTGFAPMRDSLNIAFMASAHAPWHGVDRLLRSLDAYRGSLPICVHMIGNAPAVSGSRKTPVVTYVYHGTLRGPALDDILRRCTLGVSSLAMFRNRLQQGAVLKTREYVARGLPFIYAYDDVDVPADVPYALRLANDDSLIDVGRVVEFARAISRDPSQAQTMRTFAEQELSWDVKLSQLQKFAQALV